MVVYVPWAYLFSFLLPSFGNLFSPFRWKWFRLLSTNFFYFAGSPGTCYPGQFFGFLFLFHFISLASLSPAGEAASTRADCDGAAGPFYSFLASSGGQAPLC